MKFFKVNTTPSLYFTFLAVISAIVSIYYSAFIYNQVNFEGIGYYYFPVTVFLNFFLLAMFPVYPIFLLSRLLLKNYSAYLCVLFFGIFLTYLVVDFYIYQSFKFHFNSFVFKVLTAQQGVKTVGLGNLIYLYFGGLILFFSLLSFCILKILEKSKFLVWFQKSLRGGLRRFAFGIFVFLIILADKSVFAWYSFVQNNNYVLTLRRQVPLYVPLQMGETFIAMGLGEYEKKDLIDFKESGFVNYPLEKYSSVKIPSEDRKNLIIIMVDALRDDMLSPEYMPNMNQLVSERGIRFKNHFSGSNGTSDGLFSFFFGLPASYLESFGQANTKTLFFEPFKANDYRFGIYASNTLNFWNTLEIIFGDVIDFVDHDQKEGSIEGDRVITEKAIDFVEKNKENPYLLYVFYDSVHLPHFQHPDYKKFVPDNRKINFNPANADERLGSFNAYKNAAFYVDSMIGNLIQKLKETNQFENSIIIFTADHGSEKYEHGHWGHASAFTKEQLHTPFWLWYPGAKTETIHKTTDHHDVMPTIFHYYGDTFPIENYTIGIDLFSDETKDYHIASSLTNKVLFDEEYKINYTAFEGISYYEVTDSDDDPVENPDQILAAYNSKLLDFFRVLGKFYQ